MDPLGGLEDLRERLKSSLWFLPGVMVLATVGLAVAITIVDRWVEGAAQVELVFGGSADAGRSVLSVIAGSMVSLTALVFSILIVVFQLTSSQFTPRALRTFLQDRVSKITLGAFLATFAYSLTVMRVTRGANGQLDEFVPRISISLAFLFSLATMGVFVYYIHHVSLSIRVSSILERIHADAASLIERILTEGEERLETASPANPPSMEAVLNSEPRTVRSRGSGYITSVRSRALLSEAKEKGVFVRLVGPVGTFISLGRPLLEVWPAETEVDEHALLGAVHLGSERTTEQDLGYGFRQLADIAVRALSPGVNDPTPASMAIDRIEDLLLRLDRMVIVDDVRRDEEGWPRLRVPRQSWESVLHEGLHEAFYYGRDSPQVAERLRALVAVLREEVSNERMEPVGLLLRRLDGAL